MKLYIFLFWIASQFLFSQNPDIFLGEYRSPDNPYYWKNKRPRPDYWQQDVHYKIQAILDDSNDVIYGNLSLKYYNNAPDTLKELFFHLNENAFTPGSYYHDLHLNNNSHPKFGKNASNGLGLKVSDIQVSKQNLTPVLDNTVMKISLAKPIPPNDSVTITMKFETYFDIEATMRRRMKLFRSNNSSKHYDAVHWYPQVCVYDSKFGWTTDQHLDKEFYNNFGTFEVELSLPKHYVLDGTGILQNEQEVLPDSLRQKLKLSNFVGRKPTDPISTPIPISKEHKVWKFRAVNVHNFAFTADPLYRIDEVEWNNIKSMALVQEPNCPRWKGAVEFAMNVIKIYSRDFGMYAWPKIIIADAKDGMEYPMITLDNGYYPQNQQLLAHEIGHMWFYGMLGSNETYRASMDEGFTQFLTIWAMDKLTGSKKERVYPNKFLEKRLKPYVTRFDRLYEPYIATYHKNFDEQLNTHSCAFHGALRHGGNYGLVYYKTGVMLYNLKYTLGDSLFLKAMQNYVKEWKMCHPYPEDFRSSIIHFTHFDLNWFFDQWLESTKAIDYKVLKPKRNIGDSTYTYTLKIKRIGRMHMPLDLSIKDENNQRYQFHIPNTWNVKDTKASILPKWYGWDLLKPKYEATVILKAPIHSIQIDTSLQLADVDLRNNHWNRKSKIKFDYFSPEIPSWDKTDKYWRPDIWYNGYDGIQAGIHFKKGYFQKLTNYEAGILLNTGILKGTAWNESQNSKFNKFSYYFYNKSNINHVWKYSFLKFNSSFLAGLIRNTLGIEKVIKKQDDQNLRYWTLGINTDLMLRPRSSDLNYLFYETVFLTGKIHNNLNMYAERKYILHKRQSTLLLELRTPSLFSDFNYNFLQAQNLYTTYIKKIEIKMRVFARLSYIPLGASIPSESIMQLGYGNLEDSYSNKYFRATGIFPTQWNAPSTKPIIQQTGGLNIRAFANLPYNSLYSNVLNGLSFNMDVDIDQIFGLRPIKNFKNFSFDLYGFYDMALYNANNIGAQQLLPNSMFANDLGIGTALKIKFGYFDIKPLVLRAELPIATYHSIEDVKASRLVLGIGRCF